MLSLETDVREDCKNNVKDKSPGFVSGSATKPVSYDTYSTDTSSQFRSSFSVLNFGSCPI